ncbi:NAD(P)-binding protein [Atractiella rhizophila]|nr:NAD(P)-binding protein [Atractiella rhizophila]
MSGEAQNYFHVKGGVFEKFELKGKVAVVTGGARGLGYEMARALCEAGLAGIAIVDILQEFGEAAIKELHADFGLTASFYKVDVRDSKAVEEVMNGVIRDFGQIDVLICSAGVADNISAEDYPADRFKRVIDINLNGTFFCAQACAKHMIPSGRGGAMIFIGSMSGRIVNYPQPQCAYNASKAAVVHLMKSLAAEWAPHKIRVNAISPGYMNTVLNEKFDPLLKKTWYERTPQARMGHVSDLNGAALYLASEAASFTTGTDLLVDGGYCTW